MDAPQVRLGARWKLLHGSACNTCAKLPQLRTAAGIAAWLVRFKSDRTILTALENFMSRCASGGSRHGLRSAGTDTLGRLTSFLAAGEFHICSCPERAGGSDGTPGSGGGGAGSASSGSTRLRVPRTPQVDRFPPPFLDQSSLLAGNSDAAAIADTQRRAARAGAAFCEECVK